MSHNYYIPGKFYVRSRRNKIRMADMPMKFCFPDSIMSFILQSRFQCRKYNSHSRAKRTTQWWITYRIELPTRGKPNSSKENISQMIYWNCIDSLWCKYNILSTSKKYISFRTSTVSMSRDNIHNNRNRYNTRFSKTNHP